VGAPPDRGGLGAGESAGPETELAAPPPSYRAARREPDEEDERYQKLAAYLARALVDFPEEVQVSILETGETTALELRVHQDDLAHVIGRQGRTARSMRLVLSASAARVGRKASLEIAD
jgi:predicted RNA-binding protein YlqC (UPF0109 family)